MAGSKKTVLFIAIVVAAVLGFLGAMLAVYHQLQKGAPPENPAPGRGEPRDPHVAPAKPHKKGIEALFEAILAGNDATVEKLIDGEVDVNKELFAQGEFKVPVGKHTPLSVAVYSKQLDIVRLLLKKGANANFTHRNGTSMLNVAMTTGQSEVAKLLVQHGAKVDTRSRDGETSLHKLARGTADTKAQRIGMINDLLANGQKANETDNAGRTPLHVAAGARNNTEIISILIKAGARINAKDSRGETPIVRALRSNLADNARTMLREDPKAVIKDLRDSYRSSPLHHAVKHGLTDLIDILIKRGCDIDARDAAKESPLHLCAKSRYTAGTTKLIKLGTDLNAENSIGNTPLHLAASMGRGENVALLIKAGAKLDTLNRSKQTPMLVAANFRKWDIVEMLLDAKATAGKNRAKVLSLAAAAGQENIVRRLTDGAAGKTGDNPTTKAPGLGDEALGEALCAAARRGSNTELKLLLKKGAKASYRDRNGRQPMHYAAQAGKVAAISILKEAGGDVNALDRNGWSPLYLAAQGRSKETLDALVKAGAKVNLRGKKASTPLHAATWKRNVTIVKALLELKADPKIIDGSGSSAVHAAAAQPEASILELFAKNGASLDLTDAEKRTPLMRSISAGRQKCAEFLLRSGADASLRDKDGQTAMHYAARQRQSVFVQALVKKNAKVNAQDNAGLTPLHAAIDARKIETAKALLKLGANPKLADKYGITPVQVARGAHAKSLAQDIFGDLAAVQPLDGRVANAVKQQDQEEIRKLVADGARLDGEDEHGMNILHYAAKLRKPDMLAFLLKDKQARAMVNTPDRHGRAPLHVAISQAAAKNVELLLEAKADPNASDLKGKNAVYYASRTSNVELLKAIVKAGGKLTTKCRSLGRTPLLGAAEEDHNPACLEEMIKLGADVNARDKLGNTALILAKDWPVVAVLLKGKAKVNVRNKDGETPLHTATRSRNARMLMPLLKAGANPNVKGMKGQTPLIIAIRGDSSMAAPILKAKADVNIQDDEGRSALHHAAFRAPALIPALIAAKADVNLQDNEGNTPLHVAVASGDVKSVKALVSAKARADIKNNDKRTALDEATKKAEHFRSYQPIVDLLERK